MENPRFAVRVRLFARKGYEDDTVRRVRLSESRDNGGSWWLCKTTRSPKDLERLFRQGETGGILLDVTGGILGSKSLFQQGLCYVQLSVPDRRDVEMVNVCLQELGVTPLRVVRRDEITQE